MWFVTEGAHRLVSPPPVAGLWVFVTALAGIAVNLAASWSLRRADRTSLNVQGAFTHILNDLFAFLATAAAGAVVWASGFARADAIAALLIAVIMAKAGWGLVRDATRVFLEAAPAETDPEAIGSELVELQRVVEVHDLHIWQITSGQPALSAHVLVEQGADCHGIRVELEQALREEHAIAHTTLQVDHARADGEGPGAGRPHCLQAHGSVYRTEERTARPYPLPAPHGQQGGLS